MNELPASPPRISLLVVDDHQLILEGIKTLLKTDAGVAIAAQAHSGTEALRRLREHPEVQVAIIDMNMPEMSGIELTGLLRTEFPQVRVLVLSMFYDYDNVTAVLAAGAAGYLLKNTSKAELSQAIRAVAAGRTHFSQEVGSTLLQHLDLPAQRGPATPQPVELTAREREILQLVAQEKSNQVIAEDLFISERTVETHRKNILTKTGCKTVVGLIQYALKHKLIS